MNKRGRGGGASVRSARRLHVERILASIPDAIISLDQDHRVVEWNAGAQRMFGYTYDEAVGRDLDELVARVGTGHEGQARGLTSMLYKQHTIPYTESVRYRKDNTPVPVLLSGSPIIEDDRILGFVVIYRDISERKRAEAERESLLKANQMLLKEAHHRIKNDLLMICSMLSLQARRAQEPAAAEAITEASKRVSAIGAIYTELYTEETFHEVELSQLLTRSLEHFGDCHCRECFSLDILKVVVSPRLAVALGIIANELVTNALKYSGGDPCEGSVQVSVKGDGEGGLRLLVRDSGGGYPEPVLAGGGRGFGLDIVTALAHQHEGELRLYNENGAVAELTVPFRPVSRDAL